MTYQVNETPHSILLATDTLTRVKAALSHFSGDGVHLKTKQM